jgi:hypothetical protein
MPTYDKKREEDKFKFSQDPRFSQNVKPSWTQQPEKYGAGAAFRGIKEGIKGGIGGAGQALKPVVDIAEKVNRGFPVGDESMIGDWRKTPHNLTGRELYGNAQELGGSFKRANAQADYPLWDRFKDSFNIGKSAADINRERQAGQKATEQNPQNVPSTRPGVTRTEALPRDPTDPNQSPFERPISNPNPVVTNTQNKYNTGNRYLDMAYAGSDELQKYVQGMPESDRPVDLIRGTQRSFYDPRSQREYGTMAEAAYGVSRPEMMEQYAIDAPMQSKERMAIMEMMGRGEKGQEFTYQKMSDPATGQDYLIKLSKDGQVVENLGTGQDIQKRIDPVQVAQFQNEWLPQLMTAAQTSPEEYQKVRNKMPETMKAIADRFFQ